MEKTVFSHYEVCDNQGVCLFVNPCYSICNSFIINNALMGIRPKEVRVPE